jgi:ABC-2 type transport system ATP-binding protein
MIRTRGLGKVFLPPRWPLSLAVPTLRRRVLALSNVSLDVERGEILGVVGPNGAGKTTLLRILATLLLPSEGSAHVNGTDLVIGAAAVRRTVALASAEDRGFYWRLTGLENLEFFAGLRGLHPGKARRRARALAEALDLAAICEEPVARYTTGMRQRLNVARALLDRPTVLLLDEPTRSLDPVATSMVRALVARLAVEDGVTIVIATHDLDEAESLCDRVAILDTGLLRAIVSVRAGEGRLQGFYHRALGRQ